MDENNEFGCTPCFCYGHSSVCKSAVGYSRVQIHSFFDRSSEKWTAVDDQKRPVALNYNGLVQNIEVSAPDRSAIYFVAPDRFLGDQRASYNRDLRFVLQIAENGASPSTADVILEGSGIYISNTIFGAKNKPPGTEVRSFLIFFVFINCTRNLLHILTGGNCGLRKQLMRIGLDKVCD